MKCYNKAYVFIHDNRMPAERAFTFLLLINTGFEAGKGEADTKNRKYDLAAFMMAVLVGAAVLFGCGEPSGAVSKEEPLTVYLWENSLIKNLVPYIHEQLPDQDIEFIVGNNDTRFI